MNDDALLTFGHLRSIELPDYRLTGPLAPITDYRIAAGLLFERYNSQSYRTCIFASHGQWSEIVLSQKVRIPDILVKNACIRNLHKEGFLDREWERGVALVEGEKLRLNKAGMRQVVAEWFVKDSALIECLMAGATYNTESQSLSWG